MASSINNGGVLYVIKIRNYNHLLEWIYKFRDGLRSLMVVFVIYVAAFIYLFIQNFIFSQNIDLLYFRTDDSLAFHNYLLHIHQELKFFNLNGYRYGWIYWFPLAFITYPFFLLSTLFGIDMPLLVIPRQVSLCYTFATAFLLFKIASIYTRDNFLKSVVLLLFLSFPTTGHFSLIFGSTTQAMFFSTLAFYLTARKEIITRQDLVKIALVLGIAVATKTNALLITPLIFFIIADRLSWKLNDKSVYSAYIFVAVFFISFFCLGQVSIGDITKRILQNIMINEGDYLGVYGSVSNFFLIS